MKKFALVFALFSLTAFGQATSSLSGVVVDPTGAVVPGVEVVAKNNATAAEFKTITVENGTFAIPALDAGTYTVTVNGSGFAPFSNENVVVEVGRSTTFDVPLSFLPGGQSWIAEIYADGPKANWVTNPLPVTISKHTVTSASTLRVVLAAGGGQAIRIRSAR